MAYKREEQIYQPDPCLNCRYVWGADCEFTEDGKAETNSKDFWCSEYSALKPINGKKKDV